VTPAEQWAGVLADPECPATLQLSRGELTELVVAPAPATGSPRLAAALKEIRALEGRASAAGNDHREDAYRKAGDVLEEALSTSDSEDGHSPALELAILDAVGVSGIVPGAPPLKAVALLGAECARLRRQVNALTAWLTTGADIVREIAEEIRERDLGEEPAPDCFACSDGRMLLVGEDEPVETPCSLCCEAPTRPAPPPVEVDAEVTAPGPDPLVAWALSCADHGVPPAEATPLCERCRLRHLPGENSYCYASPPAKQGVPSAPANAVPASAAEQLSPIVPSTWSPSDETLSAAVAEGARRAGLTVREVGSVEALYHGEVDLGSTALWVARALQMVADFRATYTGEPRRRWGKTFTAYAAPRLAEGMKAAGGAS